MIVAGVALSGCAAGPGAATVPPVQEALVTESTAVVGLTASYAAADLAFDGDGPAAASAELAWGDGYALAAEFALSAGGKEGGAAGFTAEYARTEHDEIQTGTRSEAHLATLSAFVRPWRLGGDVVALAPRLSGGFGVLVVDHAALGPGDDHGLTANAGLDLELHLFGHLLLRAGGRFSLAGFPGDTLATGGLVVVGGGVTF